MSTFPVQTELSPSWKLEVNQRLAAHRSRKGISAVEPKTRSGGQRTATSRSAAAAARVAARFANAPSYNELLADEARAAVCAAEAVSQAALEAQAAAESLLAGLEAAPCVEPAWETFEEPQRQDAASSNQLPLRQSPVVRPEPEMPVRAVERTASRPGRGAGVLDAPAESRWEPPSPRQDAVNSDAAEAAAHAQPIHANLIQFPREIVAPRKARPRLAERPHDAGVESEGQLSIFEVDPAATMNDAVATDAVVEREPRVWPAPEWSGIELDAQPLDEVFEEPARQAAAAVELAPLSRRLLAVVVDALLITGTSMAAAIVALNNMKDLPSIRGAEMGAAVALAAVGILYHLLFFIMARGTPGMKYAGVSLCTFKDEVPTRSQRCGRLGALSLSVLPVGLGVAWAIFDDEHLSWHDRLSGTYLRKG